MVDGVCIDHQGIHYGCSCPAAACRRCRSGSQWVAAAGGEPPGERSERHDGLEGGGVRRRGSDLVVYVSVQDAAVPYSSGIMLRLAACAIRRHSGSVETPPDAHVATPTAAAMAVTQHDATQRNATHRVGFIGTEQHEVVAGHASCERSLGTIGLGLKVLAHGQHKRIAVCHHDGHGQHLERPSDQAHACSRLGRMQASQHSRRAEQATSQRSVPGQGT